MTGPTNGKKGAAGERTPQSFPSEKNIIASSAPGNSDRKLIRTRGGLMLYELAQGRGKFYEIVSPIGECWRFSLRYQAESKFDRLTRGGVQPSRGAAK
jgi:hypothetical protein